jgi:hypothetical protein
MFVPFVFCFVLFVVLPFSVGHANKRVSCSFANADEPISPAFCQIGNRSLQRHGIPDRNSEPIGLTLWFLNKDRALQLAMHLLVALRRFWQGGFMSQEFWSAIKGSGVGVIIGFVFGIATLSTIGFDLISLFQGALLVSCSMFGGFLFGALIGVTGAFRKESGELTAVVGSSARDFSRVA